VFVCPIPPPPRVTRYIRKSTYSHREGTKGGGGSSTRGKVRGATVHKAGSKIPTMFLQSINSDKHLPQSPSTGVIF
jgi:hypothetical protein